MRIITLTTDYGIRDHYVAALKGSLLSAVPGIQIADISNIIQPFNLVQAGFVVRNAWHHFPEQTIHIISVEEKENAGRSVLALHYHNHYFLAYDNGTLPLIFNGIPADIVSIDRKGMTSSKLFSELAKSICNNVPVEQLGQAPTAIIDKRNFLPTVDKGNLISTIIYVDDYGNAVTNIDEKLFEQHRKGRDFNIALKSSGEGITSISKGYHQVKLGEIAAIINEAGYLEIGMNNAKASQMLNLKFGMNLRIQFNDNTNRKADHQAHAHS